MCLVIVYSLNSLRNMSWRGTAGIEWRETTVIEWATEGNICALRSLPHRELNMTANVHWICTLEAAEKGRAETCDFFAKCVIETWLGTDPVKQQTSVEFCLDEDPDEFHDMLSETIQKTCKYIAKGGNMATCSAYRYNLYAAM